MGITSVPSRRSWRITTALTLFAAVLAIGTTLAAQWRVSAVATLLGGCSATLITRSYRRLVGATIPVRMGEVFLTTTGSSGLAAMILGLVASGAITTGDVLAGSCLFSPIAAYGWWILTAPAKAPRAYVPLDGLGSSHNSTIYRDKSYRYHLIDLVISYKQRFTQHPLNTIVLTVMTVALATGALASLRQYNRVRVGTAQFMDALHGHSRRDLFRRP